MYNSRCQLFGSAGVTERIGEKKQGYPATVNGSSCCLQKVLCHKKANSLNYNFGGDHDKQWSNCSCGGRESVLWLWALPGQRCSQTLLSHLCSNNIQHLPKNQTNKPKTKQQTTKQFYLLNLNLLNRRNLFY